MNTLHGTTVVVVRYGGNVAMAADGQVTTGESVIMKNTARKVRRIGDDGEVLIGFAGSVADALTLVDIFASKYNEEKDIIKSAIALAKEWRTNRNYHHLEAELLIADIDHTLYLTGNGDVIEPDRVVAAIGSGGLYALSAALAYVECACFFPDSGVESIVRSSLRIASELCVYTNDNITVEVLNGK